MWAVQAGTAVSERVRGNIPNSLNIVRYKSRTDCVVERWDYSDEEDAFCEFASTVVELATELTVSPVKSPTTMIEPEELLNTAAFMNTAE